MSLRSMTGFGRGEASADGVKAVVEIGSVNRRQMDIYIVLPKALQIMEPRIHEEIHNWVSRGRIKGEVLVSRSGKAGKKTIHIDEALAQAYVTSLKKVARKVGIEDSFSGDLLLALPDVVSYEQATDDPEKLWPLLLKALKRSLKDFDTMRRHEGVALQKDLENRLRLLSQILERITKRAPKVVRGFKNALLTRLDQAGLDINAKDERVIREVILFADKSDISEEITRLGSHVDQMHRLMDTKDAVGKSMDFLAQEMFREINTIGSKANDATVQRHVVSFKAELERLREQIQNVE